MIELLLFLCLALPVAWLISEAQSRRWISVILGIAAISLVGFVAYAWAQFVTKFERNVYSGNANEKLLNAMSEEFERGNAELAQQELNHFAKKFHSSYEDYPRYEEQVDSLVGRLKEADSARRTTSNQSTGVIISADGQVTIRGEYHIAGKFGPYIPLGNTAVYLNAEGSSSWPNFEGQQVEVSGQLRLVPAGFSEQENVAVAPARLLLTTSPNAITVIEGK